MDINKTYTSRAGAKRTPLLLSECGRFIKTQVIFSNGKTVVKEYWKVIFEERIKNGLWNQ